MKPTPTLPYGSWPSPISVAMAVAGSRGLSEPQPDGDDLYFLESRPDEAGRAASHHDAPETVLSVPHVHPRDGRIGQVQDLRAIDGGDPDARRLPCEKQSRFLLHVQARSPDADACAVGPGGLPWFALEYIEGARPLTELKGNRSLFFDRY